MIGSSQSRLGDRTGFLVRSLPRIRGNSSLRREAFAAIDRGVRWRFRYSRLASASWSPQGGQSPVARRPDCPAQDRREIRRGRLPCHERANAGRRLGDSRRRHRRCEAIRARMGASYRCVKQVADLAPSLAVHPPLPSRSWVCSQARPSRQSRSTVATETPSDEAISATVRPPNSAA